MDLSVAREYLNKQNAIICALGEMEIINDGSDGTRPVIFIHADHRTDESEWW